MAIIHLLPDRLFRPTVVIITASLPTDESLNPVSRYRQSAQQLRILCKHHLMNELRGEQFDLADDKTEFGVDARDDNHVDMLVHDYISENTEAFRCLPLADGVDGDTAEFVAGQERDSFVSAERDESGAAVMIEMPEFHA